MSILNCWIGYTTPCSRLWQRLCGRRRSDAATSQKWWPSRDLRKYRSSAFPDLVVTLTSSGQEASIHTSIYVFSFCLSKNENRNYIFSIWIVAHLLNYLYTYLYILTRPLRRWYNLPSNHIYQRRTEGWLNISACTHKHTQYPASCRRCTNIFDPTSSCFSWLA